MIPRCSCLPAARPVAVPYRETASAQGCISKKWVRLVRTHTIFSLVPQHISRCEAHFTSPSGRTSFTKKNHTISRVVFSLCWRYLSSRAVTRKVLSAKVSLTSVFGMGTGGPSPQSTPTRRNKLHFPRLGLRSKARLFRCSSSQNHNRFAGLRFCRGTWIYPEN